MEQDRYQTDKPLYISGILCLIGGLSLLIFSIYLLPHLVWNLSYDVPILIQHMYYYLHTHLRISDFYSQLIIFLTFFLSGVVLTLYSYYASNKIDNKIYEPELPQKQQTVNEEEKEGFWLRMAKKSAGDFSLLFKILILMGLILLAAYFVESIL